MEAFELRDRKKKIYFSYQSNVLYVHMYIYLFHFHDLLKHASTYDISLKLSIAQLYGKKSYAMTI